MIEEASAARSGLAGIAKILLVFCILSSFRPPSDQTDQMPRWGNWNVCTDGRGATLEKFFLLLSVGTPIRRFTHTKAGSKPLASRKLLVVVEDCLVECAWMSGRERCVGWEGSSASGQDCGLDFQRQLQ